MSEKTEMPGPAPSRLRSRFAVVLAASLLLAVAQPLTSGFFDEAGSFDVFFSLLVGAVLFLVFEEPEHRRIALTLGVTAFCGIWIGHGIGGPAGRAILVGSQLLGAGMFAFALYGILRSIFIKQASGDAILGALCGYLLIGIIWGLFFSAAETAWPGSFCRSSVSATGSATVALDRGTLSYYSFITLATVGYGDIIPTTPLTRTLAWMEAIAGQFYLAVLVAGLVGFKVSQSLKE